MKQHIEINQTRIDEMPKRVLVVGPDGLLGHRIVEIFKKETAWTIFTVAKDVVSNGKRHLTINNAFPTEFIDSLCENEFQVDVIINTAALTNVDLCETNRTKAWETNVNLVDSLIHVAKRTNALFIQISTDYIFDGDNGPYIESSVANPINYYGRTKLAAENLCHGSNTKHLIIRTMWLYGPRSKGGRQTFVNWVLNELETNSKVQVVIDEIGTPTYTDDVVYSLIRAIEKDAQGVFNVVGPSRISRFDFARLIAQVNNFDPSAILPTTTEKLSRLAKRPLNSGLINLRAQTTFGIGYTSATMGLQNLKMAESRYNT